VETSPLDELASDIDQSHSCERAIMTLSLDGRNTGHARTCGFNTFVYDNRGVLAERCDLFCPDLPKVAVIAGCAGYAKQPDGW
jgi:hypothetical protein